MNCPTDRGTASACQGCPNQTTCASSTTTAAKEAVDPDLEIIQQKLAKIQYKIAILSGKGGVGKSTFTCQLGFSLALSNPDLQVGILDLDICGPSIPRMTGTQGNRIHASRTGWTPVYPLDNLGVVSVSFMLDSEDSAVIWRGPKKNALIKQVLRDVDWGPKLDFLLIDTPPGTSDEHISLAQFMFGVSGAVLVTTPQEVSVQDVRKEVDFCNKVKMPILGIVENMSGFVCPSCKCESVIFPGSGGRKLAEKTGIAFLGGIPLDPAITRACELGFSIEPNEEQEECDAEGEKRPVPSPSTLAAYQSIVEKLIDLVVQ